MEGQALKSEPEEVMRTKDTHQSLAHRKKSTEADFYLWTKLQNYYIALPFLLQWAPRGTQKSRHKRLHIPDKPSKDF